MKPNQALYGLFLTWVIHLIRIQGTTGAKILSVGFFSTRSHKITYERLLIELAKRGHEVTYVGPLPSGKNITNLKEILTYNVDLDKDAKIPNFFEMKLSPMFKFISPLMNPFILFAKQQEVMCRRFYQLPQVQQLLSQKFDLVFVTPMFNECVLGLVHKLNTISVLYTPIQVLPWIAGDLGSPQVLSFVPSPSLGFDDRMSFLQRVQTALSTWYVDLTLRWYYYPKMEAAYREELGDSSIPSASQIVKNASIVLANAHVSFERPRPQMPDIIDVGGLTMTPAKAVPKDLDDFFRGAGDHGVIYFSMGSAVKGSTMPDTMRQTFLNVFAKLKQRVLWKWETESMENLPPNVKLSKWVPQTDVLGDKRLRLFITHGGHGSISESIYHGIPLIGIPILGDQPGNIFRAAKAGFSYPPLELADITEETLFNAISTVLNEPSYRQSAKKVQRLFHDQTETPMERAVFWIEYVIRHQGAVHLRSAARDLGFFQYYSIDVLLTLLVAFVAISSINLLILRAFFRCLLCKKSVSVGKAKKTQ